MAARLFTLGMVLILFGVQFRQVKTFVLTPEASEFIQQRLDRRGRSDDLAAFGMPVSYHDQGIWSQYGSLLPTVSRKSISPPNWLGFSLISAGVVMVLGYPCFRK